MGKRGASLRCSSLDLLIFNRWGVCQGGFTHCSYTGKRRIALKGTNDQGVFLTLIAQPYPFALRSAVAEVVAEHVRVQIASG